MIYKILTLNEDGKTIYARIDVDGKCRLTCTEDYPEFQAWLAEGNTPEPADIPVPVIPSTVSMRQARLALLQAGLLSTVNAAIEAGSEADKITWEYATEVNRNTPLVQNMQAMLGLTNTDLDNLFTSASTL